MKKQGVEGEGKQQTTDHSKAMSKPKLPRPVVAGLGSRRIQRNREKNLSPSRSIVAIHILSQHLEKPLPTWVFVVES